jgi:hypothetical protein
MLIFSGIFITVGLIAIVIALTLGAKLHDNGYYKTIDFTQNYVDVTSLDVDVDVGDVEIKEGQEFKIEARGVVKERFESEVKDGVWKVKERGKKYFIDFFWEIGDSIHMLNYSPKITIYVPKDFILMSLV